MCSTTCALEVVGEYRKLQFLVATGLVSRPCVKLGRKEKIILKYLRRRMNSECIRMDYDGVSQSFKKNINHLNSKRERLF